MLTSGEFLAIMLFKTEKMYEDYQNTYLLDGEIEIWRANVSLYFHIRFVILLLSHIILLLLLLSHNIFINK